MISLLPASGGGGLRTALFRPDFFVQSHVKLSLHFENTQARSQLTSSLSSASLQNHCCRRGVQNHDLNSAPMSFQLLSLSSFAFPSLFKKSFGKNLPRRPEKALPLSPFLPFIISSRLAWTGGGGTPHLRFPFLPPPSVGAATAKIFRNLKFLPLLTSLSSSLQKIVVLHTPSEAVCMPPLQLCLCRHGALLPLSYALYKSLPTYLFPKKNLSFPRRTAAEGGKIKGGMFEIPSKIDTSPDHNAQSLLEEARLWQKACSSIPDVKVTESQQLLLRIWSLPLSPPFSTCQRRIQGSFSQSDRPIFFPTAAFNPFPTTLLSTFKAQRPFCSVAMLVA